MYSYFSIDLLTNMINFVKWILLIIAALSFKLNIKTYRDEIEAEVRNKFIRRFFCIIGADDSCDEYGERIKSNMIDLLENECSRCSLQMQAIGVIAIPYVKEEFPDLWKLVERKYQNQDSSVETYFFSAYECLLQDLNCNSSHELLKKAIPYLLKLKFVPGREDVTILFGHQLKIIEKKYPFIYNQLLEKFTI